MTTFTVYRCAQGSETAESGLSPTEVARHIWTYDGKGFRLEARMVAVLDDNDEPTGEEKQVEDSLGLKWDVYFTKAGQLYGSKSRLTAYGATEELAEAELLQDAFDRSGWDEGDWMVLTDEQHQQFQAEDRAEAEARAEASEDE